MNRWLLILMTSGTTLFASQTLLPSSAEACGNSMHRLHESAPVSAVERAWNHVEAQQYELAISLIEREFETIEAVAADASPSTIGDLPAVTQRALHVLATAVVRSRGEWSRATEPELATGDAALANIRWATTALEALAPLSDAGRAHHAEALALDSERRADARVTLEALASKGGLSDAASWKLLGELRAENGESAAAKLAFDTAGEIPLRKGVPRSKAIARSKGE